jgi:hypothetical protein
MEETSVKVGEFYASGALRHTHPMPGAKNAVETLVEMGFQFVVVTAREAHTKEETICWLDKHFDGRTTCSSRNLVAHSKLIGLLKDVIFTGHSEELTEEDVRAATTRLTKQGCVATIIKFPNVQAICFDTNNVYGSYHLEFALRCGPNAL